MVHPENAGGVIAPRLPLTQGIATNRYGSLSRSEKTGAAFDLVRGSGKQETPTYTGNPRPAGPDAATPSLMKWFRQGALREPVVSPTKVAAGFEHGCRVGEGWANAAWLSAPASV